MLNRSSKWIALAFLLVSFFGQAFTFANSLGCESSFEITSTDQSVANSDANTENGETHDDTDCCQVDCCDLNCLCLANGCSSYSYIQNTDAVGQVSLQTENLYKQEFVPRTRLHSLLYRPPIFTS